jgi:voltage-gated potassium channel
MILGYGIIAVPTGIVTAEFAKKDPLQTLPDVQPICHFCNTAGHLNNAKFCHQCGTVLKK